MKKLIVLALMLLGTTWGLLGCGGATNVTTAVDYIDALEDGDLESAAVLVCPERSDDILDSLMEVSEENRENFDFRNVSCAAQGSDVACRYNIVQDTTVDNSQEFVRNVIFEFEDGLICGFEEEVAN